MSQHFLREVERLKKRILALSAKVEENVRRAVTSVEQRDRDLAVQAIECDTEIDRKEVEVEEECLKILALYQPVAIDLRFIVAVLKINNDLERIGDLAVNIAEHGAFLAVKKRTIVPFDLPGMTNIAQAMLKNSLSALVNLDTKLAKDVCAMDDELDTINREMYGRVEAEMRNQRDENLSSLIHFMGISRHLERIGDLASNIAEDVIYMVDGEIIRHRAEDYAAD